MKSDENIMNKKPSRRRYILAAVVLLLCVVAGYNYLVLTWTPINSESQRASEKIICKQIARILFKDPNKLTDDDLAKITSFAFCLSEVYDIKLLEKFTNLERLQFFDVHYPERAIPKWMKILAKLGFFDLDERYAFDLSPLRKLIHLQELRLSYISVSDLEPINKLSNLEVLELTGTQVSDLEMIKELSNLRELRIKKCINITDDQIEDLKKALPNLKITDTATVEIITFQTLDENFPK